MLSTFSAKTISASLLVVVMVVSSDKVRKYINPANTSAAIAAATELAKMIEKDLSAVKVRLTSGKDLGFVKDMQDKYSKFVKTEGLAYESRLAIMLNQQLK